MSREANPGKGHDSGKVIQFQEPQSIQSQASAWLARLDGSDPSKEDLHAFKQWVNQDEAHIAAFKKVTARWDDLNVLTRLPMVQQSMQQGQRAQQAEKKDPVTRNALRLYGFYALAATVMLGVFIILKLNIVPAMQVDHWTAVGEQKTLTLPDNSVVQLNTNSRIKIDYKEKNRAIYLYQGEAYFDVEPDTQRPFEVYAGTGLVRAVGTAFSVMLSEHEVDVIVTEGVVEITPEISAPVDEKRPQAHNASLSKQPVAVKSRLIEAGNAAVFDQAEVKLVQPIEKDDIQRKLAWQQGLLIFSGESLEEVIEQISRYTDITILVKSEEARKLRIGGQFQLNDTDAIFGALDKGFGLKADYVTNSLVYLSEKDQRNDATR